LWRQVLAAVTGLPVVRRAVDDAASVGARLIVGAALGGLIYSQLFAEGPQKTVRAAERAR